MNHELKAKIKRKNKMWLLNKSINWVDVSQVKEYNRLKIEIMKDIKSSVMTFENNFASKFKTQPKLLYKYKNEKRAIKTPIEAIEAANGDVVVDKYAIATELNNYFHSVYIDDVDANILVLDKLTESKLLDIELSQHDIELRLKDLDNTKSFGVDSVHT